jgi:hypothetical protein
LPGLETRLCQSHQNWSIDDFSKNLFLAEWSQKNILCTAEMFHLETGLSINWAEFYGIWAEKPQLGPGKKELFWINRRNSSP